MEVKINNINNYAEYLTAQKSDSKIVIRKLLLIFGTIGTALGITILLFRPLIYAIPLIWVGFIILLWYLWRFVNIEYEYTITSGEISFDVIYGQKMRKKLLIVKLNEIELIAPATAAYRHRIEAQDISRRLFYCSSIDSPNLHFIEYYDKKNGKTLIFFDVIKKTAAVLKYYNSANTYINSELPF